MRIILIFFFLHVFHLPAQASFKKHIINKFELTNNMSFNFKQSINGKNEEGNCIIKYSKKIYCKYDSIHKKILVSNGKSLVIKTNKNNQYYYYPLDKTPFNLILDKDFLLDQIQKTSGNIINNHIEFTINNEKILVDIFFNKKNYDIMGWRTKDVYNNSVTTSIYNIKYNIKINDKKFNLPDTN